MNSSSDSFPFFSSLFRTNLFFLCVGTTVGIAILAILLHRPELGMILPFAGIIYFGATLSPVFLGILLFATFSTASHYPGIGLDTLLFPVIFFAWLSRQRQNNFSSKYKWLRTCAWITVAWVLVEFCLHTGEYQNNYSMGVGPRLAIYFLFFIFFLDFANEFSWHDVRKIFYAAWILSVIVSLGGIYQYVALGERRVGSILEPHHANLGNYGVEAAVIAGIITVNARTKSGKIIGVLTILLACLATMFSENRANILGLAVALAVFGLFRGVRTIIGLGVVVLIFFQVGLLSNLLEREKAITLQETASVEKNPVMETTYDPSSVDRILVWLGILDALQNETVGQIVMGVGPGNFEQAMRPHMFLHAAYMRVPNASINGAHNNYLHVLVELGLAGLILFGMFFATLLWSFYRLLRTRDKRGRIISSIMIAGTVGLLVSGFTQETFYSQSAMGNFFGMYLFICALILHEGNQSQTLIDAEPING